MIENSIAMEGIKMGQKIREFLSWYDYTGLQIGRFVVLLGLLYVAQRSFYTVSCVSIGYRCDKAIGYAADTDQRADQGLTDYMGDLLASNPNADIIVKPKGKP